MVKSTKIIATIGPASDSRQKIEKLTKSGVNIFRFNMKHADVPWHKEHIAKVRSVAKRSSKTIGILVDLQGPEIRVATPNGEDIYLKKGQSILFTEKPNIDDAVYIPNGLPVKNIGPGDQLLVDDGFNEFVITKKTANGLYAKTTDDCVVQNHKGLNLPDKKVELPSLTKDDLKRLDMAAEANVDFVALSFCRSKRDINKLRKEMEKRKLIANLVSKVESREALDNIDEIIELSDAVMIARGDLGVEVPFEELAFWQKLIIDKCRKKNTTVIVATQMLESMSKNSRPTRAEVTDVANAVLQGTDAVMLSGETAGGKFPVKAVQAMSRIAKYNEGKANRVEKTIDADNDTELIVDATSSMIHSSDESNIRAILVFTETGYTAQVISTYRPNIPIIAITDMKNTVGSLTMSYGVSPIFEKFPSGSFKLPSDLFKDLIKRSLVKRNDKVLIIHGQHWKKPGQTNTIGIHRVD